ncbi:MAG: HAMP domain-containing sensor histidine kinase [Bacilli bacterium]
MNLLEVTAINIILLLFPLLVYLFYCTYAQNINKSQNEFFLDLALISSLYLIITYNMNNNYGAFIILLDICLLIAYIKKRSLASIIISLIIVWCYYRQGVHLFYLLIIQYVIYYLLFIFCKKKSNFFCINSFIIIKTIFLIICISVHHIFSNQTLINALLVILIFAIAAHVAIFIFIKGEEIINLHLNIKEFEKDKQVRTSLFKITHEIKNPLAVCKSYLDMFDFNNKEHKNYIPIVKEEINKTLLLLQDFLDMNKIKVKKELLDINLLLEELVKQYEPVINERNIKFDYEISKKEVYIEGDYNRLNQVFINLLSNAMDAISKNGLITLRTKLDNDNINIIVKDNGCGLAKEVLEHIKEPFYTTKKNGTGLGVSLSCEIINAHNGTITYFNSKGTKVIVTIPLSKEFN